MTKPTKSTITWEQAEKFSQLVNSPEMQMQLKILKEQKEKRLRNKFENRPETIPWNNAVIYYGNLTEVSLDNQKETCHKLARKMKLNISSEIVGDESEINNVIDKLEYGTVFIVYSIRCIGNTFDDIFTCKSKIYRKCSRLICCKEKLDSIQKMTSFEWLAAAMSLECSPAQSLEVLQTSLRIKELED